MASFMNNFDTYLVAEGESRDWKLILAQLSNFTVFKNMDEGLAKHLAVRILEMITNKHESL